MAENKKGFVLYCDIIHTIKKLTDEKAGILFKHILSYVNDEDPKTDDLIIDLAFEPIKQQLKRDLNKWEETRIKRSESGKLGGLKRSELLKQNEANEANATFAKQNEANEANATFAKQNEANQANATFAKQNEANQAVIVTDIVTVTDTVNVTDTVINNNNFVKQNLRFIIPTIDEIKNYCLERKNKVDPETFYNFYQSKGWVVGKSKMKDWRACVRTWEKQRNDNKQENKFQLTEQEKIELGID